MTRAQKFSFKKFMPRTLFARSLMILVTPVLLVQVITVHVFFENHWHKMTSRLAYAVSGEIAAISSAVEEGAGPDQIASMTRLAAQHLELLAGFDPGADLGEEPSLKAKGYRQTEMVRTLSRELSNQVRRPYSINAGAEEKWVEVRIQLENGVLHVTFPQRRLFSSSGYVVMLWMIGSSFILLLVAIMFMRNQIRPIRRLAVAAERFGKGMDVPSSFKPEGAREVRQAAEAFLNMHQRLKRQMAQRTAMLAGVSHDLRTPLTRMKLQVAMMGKNPDAAALKGDIDDMERMISAYLDFARGEGDEIPVRTDLKPVLDRVVQNAVRQGAVIEQDVEDDLSLLLRPIAFERCLANIIGNAAKYAPRIWVVAAMDEAGDHIVISVDDDGPGIPEAMHEDVFKPFFRGEPSRNPHTGGVGLGLPIAQDIVHNHGGQIDLSKSARGGLCVTITLPL